MEINLTLIGEMLTFAVVVWVMVKYIWPPITKAMQDRQQKIADGLAAAERGHRDLEISQENIKKQLRDAKKQAENIITRAHQQADHIVEVSKNKAIEESKHLLQQAATSIEQNTIKAKQHLQEQTATLVIQATEKILRNQMTPEINQKLIDDFIEEMK